MVKRVYSEEEWGIEAEAFHIERHPRLLDEVEEPLVGIPERVLTPSEQALREEDIRPAIEYVPEQYVRDMFNRQFGGCYVEGKWVEIL